MSVYQDVKDVGGMVVGQRKMFTVYLSVSRLPDGSKRHCGR